MARNIPLRHELKFFINEMQYQVLSRQLDRVLWRDPNGDVNNEYHIRSLYFDTIFNDAYFDKMDGDQNRDKYRIRIYNMRDTNMQDKSRQPDFQAQSGYSTRFGGANYCLRSDWAGTDTLRPAVRPLP